MYEKRFLGRKKIRILERYEHKCAHCGARARRFEFDHVVRHSESAGANPECQILCQPCHALNTLGESKGLESMIFASTFSKRAWSQYVESDRIPPLVYKHKDCNAEACLIADVKKCRRTALELNTYAIPICCPFDRPVERTTHDLGDLCFITKKATTNCFHQLGYTGPGWLHKCLSEHLLHFWNYYIGRYIVYLRSQWPSSSWDLQQTIGNDARGLGGVG